LRLADMKKAKHKYGKSSDLLHIKIRLIKMPLKFNVALN
jgi:hypothetical protein